MFPSNNIPPLKPHQLPLHYSYEFIILYFFSCRNFLKQPFAATNFAKMILHASQELMLMLSSGANATKHNIELKEKEVEKVSVLPLMKIFLSIIQYSIHQ